jgi:hypothetical protein
MGVYKRGSVWWYRFTWKGKAIRESTKQTNKRVAEQIEAAHKTSLAKGEVGLRDRLPVLTLRQFIEQDFQPFVVSRFQNKPKTLEYYMMGVKNLLHHASLADSQLDEITNQKITSFVETRHTKGLQVSTINRQLEVLRRLLKLAVEWGKTEKVPPKVEMLPGERHRDRVLSRRRRTLYEGDDRIGRGYSGVISSCARGDSCDDARRTADRASGSISTPGCDYSAD